MNLIGWSLPTEPSAVTLGLPVLMALWLVTVTETLSEHLPVQVWSPMLLSGPAHLQEEQPLVKMWSDCWRSGTRSRNRRARDSRHWINLILYSSSVVETVGSDQNLVLCDWKPITNQRSSLADCAENSLTTIWLIAPVLMWHCSPAPAAPPLQQENQRRMSTFSSCSRVRAPCWQPTEVSQSDMRQSQKNSRHSTRCDKTTSFIIFQIFLDFHNIFIYIFIFRLFYRQTLTQHQFVKNRKVLPLCCWTEVRGHL